MSLSKETLKYILDKYKKTLQNNDFTGIYMKISRDSYIKYTEICKFTELLIDNSINPMLYMTKIPDWFLYQSSVIEQLYIPEQITEIDYEAFSKCPNLVNVEFSDNSAITKLDSHCFYNCQNLNNIVLPKSIELINHCAFYRCNKLTINYQGTKDQWSKINFGNGAVDDVKHIKCIDGYIK